MIVELNNLAFYAYHGLYDFERKDGGDFIVDVTMEEPDRAAYTDLAHVINYEVIFSIVEKHMNDPKDFIEEVARLILTDLKQAFPQALSGKVKLTKCAPPIPNMKGAAAVTCSF